MREPLSASFAAGRGLGVLLLLFLAGCAPDEAEYVQVNDEDNCVAVRVTSKDDCDPEAEAVATADVTCCGGEDIGDITVTPGCGAVGDEFELVVELETEDPQIDLSEVARVTVTVPNEDTELTEFELEQSDLQENLWQTVLKAGEEGAADRTDELCVQVWELADGDEEEEEEE